MGDAQPEHPCRTNRTSATTIRKTMKALLAGGSTCGHVAAFAMSELIGPGACVIGMLG
jgi:hypothetical protein